MSGLSLEPGAVRLSTHGTTLFSPVRTLTSHALCLPYAYLMVIFPHAISLSRPWRTALLTPSRCYCGSPSQHVYCSVVTVRIAVDIVDVVLRIKERPSSLDTLTARAESGFPNSLNLSLSLSKARSSANDGKLHILCGKPVRPTLATSMPVNTWVEKRYKCWCIRVPPPMRN